MSHLNAHFTQRDVDALLQQSGLFCLRPVDSSLVAPIALRRQARRFGGPVAFSLLGEELPGLVPPSLARAQVLYLVLPASMEQLLPRLLVASWDCYGHLTDHPWAHAVYVALSAGNDEDPAISGPVLAFRSDGIDLSCAFRDGFAILMFECAGLVWVRGIPVGQDLGAGLSTCAQGSFQRPLRIHSVRYLQERTRSVEETGADPAGPPNGGRPVLPVLCSQLARRKSVDLLQRPEHERRHLPKARWYRMSDAVIGWLPEVTHFQEECAGETPLVLKVTVMPDMYRRIQSGDLSALVQLASPSQQTAAPGYVLLVESAHELAAVTMPLPDRRFGAAYRYWARVGSCQLAFENLHNGRLHRSRVAWPPMVPIVGTWADGLADLGDDSLPGNCSAAEALVHERVRNAGRFLNYYISGVTDQEDWRRKSEED